MGKEHTFRLIENDNDGLYNKLFDPAAPRETTGPKTKPVWLSIDNTARVDTRVTFGFEGVNWVAACAPDGSSITLTPTFKTITIPLPTESPKMLSTGPVPEFTAPFFGNGDFSPQAYKGKVLVIDMWATWCGPCMKGLPHLNEVAAAAKGQNVEFVAFNVYDDKPAYEKFAASKADWALKFARDPAGHESDASIAKRLFSVSAIPATYVIDQEGKIAAAISGFDEKSTQLEDALTKLGIKLPEHKGETKPERKSVPASRMGG
jgi:thiol-disulfide isomerase/thioredoxin